VAAWQEPERAVLFYAAAAGDLVPDLIRADYFEPAVAFALPAGGHRRARTDA
jgi:hypothetical protein